MSYKSESLLRYDKPGNSINNALPLGNGSLGALVCGAPAVDRLFLNHDELWTGYPRDTSPEDKSDVYRKMRELAYEGKLAEVNELVEKDFTGTDSQCYLPLGTLELESKHGKISNYVRELDLDTATARVSFLDGGVKYYREYFVSHPDNVIAVRYTSDGGSFDLGVGFVTELKAEVAASDSSIVADGICPSDSFRNTDNFVYSDKDEEKGVSFRFALRVLTDGRVEALRRRLRVTGATEVVVLSTCVTSFNGPLKHPYLEGKEYRDASLAALDAAAGRSFAELLRRHKEDYASLWGRMSFTLNSPETDLTTERRLLTHDRGGEDRGLYVLLFNFQKYLSIAGSRPGSRAMNLQGIWNTDMRAPWSANYTVNINTEMNYWPQSRCDLTETCEPFIALVDTMRETGRKTAKMWYGASGSVGHHNVDMWGHTVPVRGCAVWLYWPNSLGWMSSQAWDMYKYSLDLDALKDRIWPSMTAAAEFYLDVLTPNEDGYLIFAPSTSPENSFRWNGEDIATSLTTAMTMEIIEQLFDDVLAAAKELKAKGEKVDAAFTKKVADAKKKLLPAKLTSDGRLWEWYEDPEECEVTHRHVSPLYALFPAHLIDRKRTPELAEACVKFLERRGDEGTGWSLGWKINLWAVLGEGDHALKLLDMQLSPRGTRGAPKRGGGTYPNMFDAHPPFQIDGNFGAGAGILNMLVREEGKNPEFLPALPAAWPEGEVRGLRLKGGKKADFKWKDGKLTEKKIY